jgi:DNA-cytosine methyltransferase
MENVTGMLSISNEFMQQVRAAFESAGYEIRWQKLNAADFGVPQTRTRVIVVAVRKDVAVETGGWFPTPSFAESPTQTLDGQSLKQWRSVQDGICDLTKHIHTHRPQGDNDGTSRVTWREGSQPSHTVKGQGSHAVRHSDSEIRLTDQLNEAHQKAGRRPLQKYSEPSNTIRSSTPPQIIFGQQVGWTQNSRRASTQSTTRDRTTAEVTTPLRNHNPRSSTEKDDPFDWEAVEPSETLSGDARLPNKNRASGAKSSRWDGSRRLTVRECARLQSFPDWAVFASENKTKQYQVVGNAVPPLLMEAVAKKVNYLLASEVCEGSLTNTINTSKHTKRNENQL